MQYSWTKGDFVVGDGLGCVAAGVSSCQALGRVSFIIKNGGTCSTSLVATCSVIHSPSSLCLSDTFCIARGVNYCR